MKALQIDFDARASERRFYKSLLEKVHRSLELPLQVTALASWCEADNWIDSDTVSEAIPMFFRMGRNESKDMPVKPVCRQATGVSTDEAWPAHHPGRLYVFNPKPWTLADYRSLQSKQ